MYLFKIKQINVVIIIIAYSLSNILSLKNNLINQAFGWYSRCYNLQPLYQIYSNIETDKGIGIHTNINLCFIPHINFERSMQFNKSIRKPKIWANIFKDLSCWCCIQERGVMFEGTYVRSKKGWKYNWSMSFILEIMALWKDFDEKDFHFESSSASKSLLSLT